MNDYRTSRVIQGIVIFVVFAIAVVAIVLIGRALFFSNTATPVVNNKGSDLVSTSYDRSVRMMERGEIVADENFHSYQIRITPSERVFTTYNGYSQQSADSISLTNSAAAYEQFVYALNQVGFMDGVQLTGVSSDTRGVCPTGRLYEFEILKANKSVKKLWTTSCSETPGSFTADLGSVTDLFYAQIPDVQSAIGKIWQ